MHVVNKDSVDTYHHELNRSGSYQMPTDSMVRTCEIESFRNRIKQHDEKWRPFKVMISFSQQAYIPDHGEILTSYCWLLVFSTSVSSPHFSLRQPFSLNHHTLFEENCRKEWYQENIDFLGGVGWYKREWLYKQFKEGTLQVWNIPRNKYPVLLLSIKMFRMEIWSQLGILLLC